jgi:hypothetical protein
MATTTWPTLLGALADLIEGLTPTYPVDTEERFRRFPGREAAEDEPDVRRHRSFLIRSTRDETGARITLGQRDIITIIEVEVHYSADLDIWATEAMMGADKDQLFVALEKPANFPTGVYAITGGGARYSRADAQRPILALAFAVNYGLLNS